MRKASMEIQENKNYQETGSDQGGSVQSQNRVTFSGPLTPKRRNNSKRSSFKDEDENEYVEITLDVRDDSVSIQDIKGAVGDQEAALLTSHLQKQRPQTLTSQLSAKLKQVSRELKRVTSSSNRGFKHLDRSKTTAARALKGLQFLNKNVGSEGWVQVEKRFEELAVDGLLLKSRFGKCIGKFFTSFFRVFERRLLGLIH